MERHTDPLDAGAELTQRLNEDATAIVCAEAAPKIVRNADGTWPYTDCVECDEPIGEPRLDLGYNTCIECAKRLESKRKQFRRP